MKTQHRQSGFTLVEIAIVLVIVGLLLGGILKGQELINSARVRNLADTNASIQAAYYGFIDRYRRVPGDWSDISASSAIGVSITGGGNDNGRIDNEAGTALHQETNALWEQLAKAGFIQGSYRGDNVAPNTNNARAPLNPFNNVMILSRTADYLDEGTPTVRLNLVLGRGIPVDIARELDVKLDDGSPEKGVVRLAPGASSTTVFGALTQSDSNCYQGTAGERIYSTTQDSEDCNSVFLY